MPFSVVRMRRSSGQKRSLPGPHLRAWWKAGLEAPMVWGFVARAGQMRRVSWLGRCYWNVWVWLWWLGGGENRVEWSYWIASGFDRDGIVGAVDDDTFGY